jgi:hypothetical protein
LRHEGRVGFVVGSGPSLHHVDVEKLKDHVVFAVNSSISKLRFANYFVADDHAVQHWNYYQDILPEVDCTCFLYEEKLKGKANHIPEDRVQWFDHTWWFSPPDKKYNPDGLVMSQDGDKPIIGARTTAGTAVHLAHLMGCSPIVLLGCDCCYEGSSRYYWQLDGEDECFRKDGNIVASFPNKGQLRDKPIDKHSKDFLKYWDALSKQASKQNISIIDTSKGLLKCFKQMEYQDLIDKYI